MYLSVFSSDEDEAVGESPPPTADRLSCPNCRALNAPGALVCTSCGINLAGYRTALPRIEALKHERASAQQEQIREDTTALLAEERGRAATRLKTQIKIALSVAAGLAVLILIMSAIYARQQQLRRVRLAAQYEQATGCLSRQDYLCARDTLEALLQEEANYPEAQARLSEARLGLAGQYFSTGQWQAAVDELDILLEANPGDAQALALLQQTYDRWILDAWSRGDIIQVFRLQLQRRALFDESETEESAP